MKTTAAALVRHALEELGVKYRVKRYERDPETGLVVIKPSGVEYDDMKADDMVVVDLEGNRVAQVWFGPATDHLEVTLTMQVDPDGGLRDDYELKTNSYDLGVDIELYDIVQRLRFEHPSVKVVVMTGGLDKIFCAGANINMLGMSTHAFKVNFCKYTNETRGGMEEASAESGLSFVAALNGTELDGRTIRVDVAQAKERSHGGGGGHRGASGW